MIIPFKNEGGHTLKFTFAALNYAANDRGTVLLTET
jgi:hypothetical protein